LEPRVLRKSEIDLDRLAELTCLARKTNKLLAEDVAEEAIRNELSARISSDCHDWVLTAESSGKLVGWLAFYEMSGSGIAQIWDWHPVAFPSEHENQVAHALIRGAVSHLGEIGRHKVAIDFRVTERTRSCFTKYLGWYSQAGITESFEETFYGRDLPEEELEVLIPDGYSLGYVSETALYVAPIGILPEYRRKGLARELLKMSMRRLKGLNYQTISCYVSTSNSVAASFYENLGFAPKHRIASLFGEIV
jgi:ribosomal protein S18 acetylase RimI-like enzyme